MVQKALNKVCKTFEGCETLAYADLSTNLVLATNESSEQTRDTLNALCTEASEILKDGHLGVIGTEDGFRFFIRDRNEPTDALICLCALETDVANLVPAAQDCLSALATGGDSA